jgi:hypothetical protein
MNPDSIRRPFWHPVFRITTNTVQSQRQRSKNDQERARVEKLSRYFLSLSGFGATFSRETAFN